MRKIFYVLIFLLIFSLFKQNVSANSKIDLCVVYEKESYEKGDVVKVSFDLPKFSNLFEVIIRVNYNEFVVKPIIYNNEYFKLNNHSIFDGFVVNKKINENTLYAELMKNDASDGYYSSYKNNLCILEFNALSHIDNIKDYFNSGNIQVFLFDINHSLIDYEIKQIKLLDAGFNRTSYDVEVYGEEVLLDDIFYVNNRNSDEFIILEEKKVDYSTLGSQILQIGVFDKVTGKYLTYSTIINVLDKEAPIIESEDHFYINDEIIDSINFVDYISVSDNYDQNVSILVNYYNKEYESISSYNDAVMYLKNNLMIYIGYVAVDGSMNKSDEKIVKFDLIDTVSPIINVSDINIIDTTLDSFDVLEYISVTDNLDKSPNVILTFYNASLELADNYKDYLTINECCYMDVYGVDSFNNISDKKRVKISLIDTTPPKLEYVEESFVNDYEVNNFDFNNLIKVIDNDERKCSISCDYIVDDVVIGDVGEFRSYLVQGKKCYIKYYVYDYSLNYNSCIIKVMVKDTLAPVISVNVENDGIYKSLDEITCEIVDNISSNLNITILLDGEVYNGGKVEEGHHVLFVEAMDESGNKITEEYSFVVSNKSFVGNLIDGNIKLNSSIIIIVVIVLSIVILLLKYRFNCRLKTINKESE